MPPFAAQHSLFRAYDIRGAQQYFTDDFLHALGIAFAQLYAQNFASQTHHATHNSTQAINTVVIGFDVRCGSHHIARTLARLLIEHGVQVVELGLVTTPMMAFWSEQYEGHGIMVTASHSAKSILGIKWLIDHRSPSHDNIAALYQSLQAHAPYTHNAKILQADPIKGYDCSDNDRPYALTLSHETVTLTYSDAIAAALSCIYPPCSDEHQVSATLDLTVVIDCLNGATSHIAEPLFASFCRQVIVLNNTPDGNFPTGNPDPTEPNRLAELQQTVILNKADIGLAFDGDGDRLMVVDNSGKVVTPDHLLYLLATVAMAKRPPEQFAAAAPRILFDIKCSHHLPQLLAASGAIPIMTKTGSSLLRQQLQMGERQAVFAGELSGHFIFNDGYFMAYDDAIYAGLRLLHWLSLSATPLNVNVNDAIRMNTGVRSTDLCGDSKEAISPYRLTDVTRHLPTIMSTADNYLPLPDNQTGDHSIVAHLTEFCHYLQCLTAPKATNVDAAIVALTSCHCPDNCLDNCLNHDRNQGQNMSVARAKKLLPIGTRLSFIDGIRLDFAHGFGVLRHSNTSNSLTVRFAGDSLANLYEIRAYFVALCRPFDTHLAEQIAMIYAE